jgi:hypothetical protein
MANKPFAIQGSDLTLGGVNIQAGSSGVVIPGVTQAVNYRVEEVERLITIGGNNPNTFGSDANAVTIIDNSRYLVLTGTTPGQGYVPAEYSVDELDDGRIEEIDVEVAGTFAAADKTRAEAGNMWATRTPTPFVSFNTANWTQIPYRPKMRAGAVENVEGGGGASSLEDLDDVQLEGPVEGSVLTWDANEEKWVNRTPASVPTGGTTGQVLAKVNGTDYNTEWVTLTGSSDGGDPAYKGFKAHYGRMWGNNDDPNGPINKIVIYKDTVTPSSTIDTSTSNDTFTVTGLTGSDVVVMLVAIGENINQTTTAELKTFAEYIIDNVILDGGVEGDINTAAAMKTAFYDNFATFSATLTDLKTGFEFFTFNNQFNISPAFATGKGATFNGLQYNMADNTVGSGSWGQDVGTHVLGDVFVIPGNTIQDADGNFLATPANDVTITVTGVTDGSIGTFTVTGTLPRPAETWPSNSIGDGGDNEYDTGNYITTNLESNISYNDGNVVTGSEAFGGGDYVVTYEASIFGVFVVNSVISSIGTTGNSGMDGYGQADTGSLYGADNGVSIGDFVFTGSTMTSPDDNLYIKAVDDLYLDALDDDIHIRANDDVRIKVGYDFDDNDALHEWRFDTGGYINFPDNSQQSTAWTGNVDWDDVNNRPSIPADVSDLTDTTNLLSVSSLVNGVHTLSLGAGGNLTLPKGSVIGDTSEIVTVTLDQFTAGGYSGTQVFTKVSDTQYELSPTGPYMTLISDVWRLKVGPATYYDSTDLITWGTVVGGSPTPVGTLGILETINLTVDTKDWVFNNTGNLTLPQGTILSETANTTVITPPGALAGQSLVIRLTGATGIISDHPGGFSDGDTITLTVTPDYNYAQVTGTVDYTFTGCTSVELGRALTGTLTFTTDTSMPISWTIPVSSTIEDFTITLSNASGFDISGISPLTLTKTGSSEDHHIHLIAGDPSITDIYLGDDDQYVKIEKNGGNVVIGTDENSRRWTFDNNGNLTLPDTTSVNANVNITIEANDTGNITGLNLIGDSNANLYAHGNVTIVSDSSDTTATWTFGTDGALTFPDDTVQSTASIQGEHVFTLNTGAITYAPTVVDFNLLFVTPAVGYSGTDPTSVTLPAGVPGQRLVIFNGYNLATLTVNPGPVGRDISSGVVAEFIYSDFEGLWMPLYGTNSP